MKTSICPICGKEFEHSRKQTYCKNPHIKVCEICGDEYEVPYSELYRYDEYHTCRKKECVNARRNSAIKEALATKPQGYNKHNGSLKKPHPAAKLGDQCTCSLCGSPFIKLNSMQKYCRQDKVTKCKVCGKDIQYICGEVIPDTCGDDECYKKWREQSFEQKHGVTNPMYLESTLDKIKQTNLEKYGTEWYAQTDECKERIKETSLQKYGVEHHLQADKVIAKRTDTVREKYGSDNLFSSEYGKLKVRHSMLKKYGVINPSQFPEFKHKATANSRTSKLEQRICNLLDNYAIKYIHHYFIKNDKYSHEFDFYLPDFNLLLDADGVYYHSYLDDPDGERVRDDYDEVRLSLVPEGCRLHVIIEGNEDQQVKDVISQLESVNKDLEKYDSKLFEWCRSIDFPYPEYDSRRLMKDWTSLCRYSNDKYIPQCRIGESIIKQFHRSLYDCHVGNYLSPKEAWYDDVKLKKVIKNRLIYKNEVDPSKVLAGFNISKVAPRVTIFNPILTKYLILKYLNEFSVIFDPFSGFSGRLLGTASLGKGYIGQDLNSIAIDESQQIIKLLQLDCDKYAVVNKDVLSSSGSYECLLTCPPYGTKERYNKETIFKSCDEWIDECLSRFKCRRYVFVVDETVKYANKVTEILQNSSHFSKMVERVIVIDA